MAEHGKPLSLDEFFVEQRKVRFIGTLRMEDGTDSVEITPFSEHRGCQCSRSITVPATAIKAVIPTGMVSPCCGKQHAVVEITFAHGSTMPIEEAVARHFAQVASAAAGPEVSGQNQPLRSRLRLGTHPNTSLQPSDNLACYWCLDNAHWAYIDALVACRSEEPGAPRAQCIQRAKAAYAAQQDQCFIMSCG